MSEMWVLLDKIGIVVGVITGVFTIWTWFYAKRILHSRKRPRPSSGDGDVALVFSLTGKGDITDQVSRFLRSNSETNEKMIASKHLEHSAAYEKIKPSIFDVKASSEGRIVTVLSKSLTDDNVGNYLNEFRKTIRDIIQLLRQDGVNKIHLFFSGPSILCTIIGSETKNSFQVALYHYNASEGHGYVFLGNAGE